METNKTGICAQVIVQNRDGKYLVVNHLKKTQHPWRFPGGKVEPIEQTKVAAKRELLEEVGIWADPYCLEPLGTEDNTIDGGLWRSHIFLVRAKNWIGAPASREPKKLGECRWCTREELLKLDVPDSLRAVVLRAL